MEKEHRIDDLASDSWNPRVYLLNISGPSRPGSHAVSEATQPGGVGAASAMNSPQVIEKVLPPLQCSQDYSPVSYSA
jgi:hypothetical protein